MSTKWASQPTSQYSISKTAKPKSPAYKLLQKRPALASVTDVNQIVFIPTPVVFFAANDSIESRLQSV